VGLKFEDLEVAREFMLAEIEMDIDAEKIHLSSYLTQSGQGNWPDLLRSAAQAGNDDSLAKAVTGMFNGRIQKRKSKGFGYIWAAVPHNANEVSAEGEFNRYFCRGLARLAINENIPRLEVYRAKRVAHATVAVDACNSLFRGRKLRLSRLSESVLRSFQYSCADSAPIKL